MTVLSLEKKEKKKKNYSSLKTRTSNSVSTCFLSRNIHIYVCVFVFFQDGPLGVAMPASLTIPLGMANIQDVRKQMSAGFPAPTFLLAAETSVPCPPEERRGSCSSSAPQATANKVVCNEIKRANPFHLIRPKKKLYPPVAQKEPTLAVLLEWTGQWEKNDERV